MCDWVPNNGTIIPDMTSLSRPISPKCPDYGESPLFFQWWSEYFQILYFAWGSQFVKTFLFKTSVKFEKLLLEDHSHKLTKTDVLAPDFLELRDWLIPSSLLLFPSIWAFENAVEFFLYIDGWDCSHSPGPWSIFVRFGFANSSTNRSQAFEMDGPCLKAGSSSASQNESPRRISIISVCSMNRGLWGAFMIWLKVQSKMIL